MHLLLADGSIRSTQDMLKNITSSKSITI